MQRASAGVFLESCQFVEKEGTYLGAHCGYGASVASLFFTLSHGPVFNKRASENLI